MVSENFNLIRIPSVSDLHTSVFRFLPSFVNFGQTTTKRTKRKLDLVERRSIISQVPEVSEVFKQTSSTGLAKAGISITYPFMVISSVVVSPVSKLVIVDDLTMVCVSMEVTN